MMHQVPCVHNSYIPFVVGFQSHPLRTKNTSVSLPRGTHPVLVVLRHHCQEATHMWAYKRCYVNTHVDVARGSWLWHFGHHGSQGEDRVSQCWPLRCVQRQETYLSQPDQHPARDWPSVWPQHGAIHAAQYRSRKAWYRRIRVTLHWNVHATQHRPVRVTCQWQCWREMTSPGAGLPGVRLRSGRRRQCWRKRDRGESWMS